MVFLSIYINFALNNKNYYIMKPALRFFCLLFALALIPQTTLAYDFKEDGLCYNVNADGKTVTMTYENLILFAYDAPPPTDKGYIGYITIPSEVKHEGKTYTVTAVDRGTFMMNTELRRVFIPATVKTIGKGAFQHCSIKEVVLPPELVLIREYTFAESGLESIVIPDKVITIGKRAFMSSSLKSISIPNSVKTIDETAFSACRWLEDVSLGNSLETIGEAAFSVCTSLKSITLPASLKEIGSKAFIECSGIESITIPASVTEIGEGVFSSCHGLTSINVDKNNKKYDSRDNCNAVIETATGTLVAGCNGTNIPKNVTKIGPEAFYGCDAFTSVEIPDSVTEIANHAFFYCHNLRNIDIPNSVKRVEHHAFCGCDSLENVVIGDSVQFIGYAAFLHDDHIKTVTIGSGVTAIEGWAFKGLDAVTSITSNIEDVRSVKMGKDVFDEIDKSACTLYVPKGTVGRYRAAPQWKEFDNIVEK